MDTCIEGNLHELRRGHGATFDAMRVFDTNGRQVAIINRGEWIDLRPVGEMITVQDDIRISYRRISAFGVGLILHRNSQW